MNRPITDRGGFRQTISEENQFDEHIDRRSSPTPMVLLPFENVACFMDQSELQEYFRKTFYSRIKNIERKFEEYMAHTDFMSLSVNDFWQKYVTVGWENDVVIPQVQMIIKSDELSYVDKNKEVVNGTSEIEILRSYPNFECDVQIASSPEG